MRFHCSRMQTLTLLFFAGLCFLLFCVNTGRNAWILSVVRQIPGRDKTGHFFLMGLLSFFVNRSIIQSLTHWKPWKISLGTLLVLLFVTCEEASQYFIPYRTFSLEDLWYNYLGVLFFGQWACWIEARRQQKQSLLVN